MHIVEKVVGLKHDRVTVRAYDSHTLPPFVEIKSELYNGKRRFIYSGSVLVYSFDRNDVSMIDFITGAGIVDAYEISLILRAVDDCYQDYIDEIRYKD